MPGPGTVQSGAFPIIFLWKAQVRFLGSTVTSPGPPDNPPDRSTYPGSRRHRRPRCRPRRRPRSLPPPPSGAQPRPPGSPRRPRPLPAASVRSAERGPATSSRPLHLRSDSKRRAVALRSRPPPPLSPPGGALTCRASSPAAARRRRAGLQPLGGGLSRAAVRSPPVGPPAASRRHQQRLWLPRAQLWGQWPVRGRAQVLSPGDPEGERSLGHPAGGRGDSTQCTYPEDVGGAPATPAAAGPASRAWDPIGPIGRRMLPRLSQTDELALGAPLGGTKVKSS